MNEQANEHQRTPETGPEGTAVGDRPLKGAPPGPRLSAPKIAKIAPMFGCLERIGKHGIEITVLRDELRLAAQHLPYSIEKVHSEVQRISAECHGEKLFTGSGLADTARSVFA